MWLLRRCFTQEKNLLKRGAEYYSQTNCSCNWKCAKALVSNSNIFRFYHASVQF